VEKSENKYLRNSKKPANWKISGKSAKNRKFPKNRTILKNSIFDSNSEIPKT